MTREEALEVIKSHPFLFASFPDDVIEALDVLIEQEPILDKVKEQIKSHLRGVEITLEVLVENDPLRPKMEGAKDTLEECLELINKYRADREALADIYKPTLKADLCIMDEFAFMPKAETEADNGNNNR